MTDIVALLHCLAPYLSNTTMRQMKHIMLAMLCIPDRITMLNIARRTERGGSYRTIQRWYHTPLDWAAMLCTIVRIHLLEPDGEYMLAGDEVVVGKAGEAFVMLWSNRANRSPQASAGRWHEFDKGQT
jgi:putative transposase